MAIQVRRGNEADFDANKMLPGEWAVSLDTKYVRMCFAPGVVLRMATYEGFEADKAQIQAILAECRSIQEVVRRIGNEVSEKASLTIEYSNSAKESAERAKIYADNAEAVTGVHIATKDRAGLIKGGDNHIAEDGTLMLITATDQTTMPNSHEGRLLVNEIGGVCEQFTTTGKQLAQDAVASMTTGIYNTALSVKADFKPNTQYTFSFKGAVGNRYYLNENMFFEDKTFTVVDGINTFTVTTKGDISSQLYSNGYLILKNHKDQPNQNKFEEVMVVEGATALPYEPYTGGQPSPNPSYPQEIKSVVISGIKTHDGNGNESSITFSSPIELNKIGDVQDVIDVERGKVVQNIEEYTIPIDISVTVYDDVEGISRFRLNVSPKIIDNDVNLLSEYFSSGYTLQEINRNSLANYCCIYAKELWFTTQRGEYTAGAFKEFIAGKKIYYSLETPTTEELPLADQIALNSLQTYDGITYLEFDSEIDPTFSGEYGTSKVGGYTLEGMLAGRNGELYGKNYVDRITALEATVVNNI